MVSLYNLLILSEGGLYMNRVYCLYRVSTSQQLYEDDIPMQRQACREFADTHGWTIIKEFYEKGISGFKTPTADRRVLQQIKKDAELRKFDILLVFMFDRLGHRDSETPFFVEDLSMSGIQIWSVKEGQQRFESHVDKLINYIRYWQASGESLKTSERIKTRMAQLTTDGIFCGGPCPYGYRLITSGRKNNRGYNSHDLCVEPSEAAVIHKMYDYHIRYGYGCRKIASELASLGIFNRQGEPFHPSSVKAILQRKQLTGVMSRGNACSDIIPELQIISPEVFRKAQQITKMRKQHQIPQRVTGQNLLSGNIFCGHCGGRIFASTARKSHHPTIEENAHIPIYKCYNRVQHRERCTGQTTYRAAKIEQVVLNQLEEYVEANRELQKLHRQFLQAELPIRKMILSQWIDRVVVHSYEHIEVYFAESEDPQKIVQQVSSQF